LRGGKGHSEEREVEKERCIEKERARRRCHKKEQMTE
jgi:hypothetical protein